MLDNIFVWKYECVDNLSGINGSVNTIKILEMHLGLTNATKFMPVSQLAKSS